MTDRKDGGGSADEARADAGDGSLPEDDAIPPLFDAGFWILAVIAAGSVIAAVAVHGPSALAEGGAIILRDLVLVMPQLVAGIVIGGLFYVLLPKSFVSWDPLESTCRHASLSIL